MPEAMHANGLAPEEPARRTVEVDVTNTGSRHGRSVVQVYLRRLITRAWPRTLELCAFEGVGLAPGERRTVRLRFEVPAGTDAVELRVARSAREANTTLRVRHSGRPIG